MIAIRRFDYSFVSDELVPKSELRSPLLKSKPGIMLERTPPRPQRLSIENKCPSKSPNAPPSSASKNRPLKTDGKTRVSMLVLPKTPESQVRNEIVISSEIKAITGNGNSSSSSHIRKSLRTIGKLRLVRKKGFNRNLLKGR
ncbi:hypothetical protein L1887_34680 [Cichorium endivia]|nr:hypothetical protein L1887_34680 [Cichorium endivia]